MWSGVGCMSIFFYQRFASAITYQYALFFKSDLLIVCYLGNILQTFWKKSSWYWCECFGPRTKRFPKPLQLWAVDPQLWHWRSWWVFFIEFSSVLVPLVVDSELLIAVLFFISAAPFHPKSLISATLLHPKLLTVNYPRCCRYEKIGLSDFASHSTIWVIAETNAWFSAEDQRKHMDSITAAKKAASGGGSSSAPIKKKA